MSEKNTEIRFSLMKALLSLLLLFWFLDMVWITFNLLDI